MGYYGIDFYYILLVLPALLLATWAQVKVKSTYKKYNRVRNIRGITGAYAAQCVLMYYGITDVYIQQIGGNLTDNYNPTTKVLSLSRDVYSGDSIAAVGIACHEVGHAIQHAHGYLPNRIRSSLVPVCNVGSTIGLPMAIIGYFLGFGPLIYAGLILYGLVALFQFVTLPVEFDASKRALKAIEERGLLYDDEKDGAKKVLRAAALTYVTSLIVSLANLLRFVLRFTNNRRN